MRAFRLLADSREPMKPGKSRWFVFGAGVGLGLSLAVTSPSRPVNGNAETHRKGVGGIGERGTRAVNRFQGPSPPWVRPGVPMGQHVEFTGRTLAMNPEGSRGGFDNPLPPWALELELEHAGARLASEISARGRAEGELAEACRRRDEHVAMLAHELRNPLNAIQGALALLGKSDAAGQTLEASRGMI